MSIIWNRLIECQNQIINIFDENAEEIEEQGLADFNQPDKGWINRVWCNKNVRRAHIDVVDARESKGLWMMHVCVFPVLNNDAPVYGFDVIAGKNKMTGAFHDFSPTANLEHEMITLGFNDSKKILIDTMDIFNNFFKFKSENLYETEVFFHKDFRTENLIYDKNNTVRLVDPDSFSNVPLDRMNNLLFFGRYMDTLTSIRERLSFAELTEEQRYKLGKGYLF